MAVLGLVFWLLDDRGAGRFGGALSALASVAAIGIGIWGALRRPNGSIRVSGTGPAVARSSGTAVSGLLARPGRSLSGQHVDTEKTGPAEASDGGQATSGATI
ncbi:hypothetical protein [Micromonospora sp. NPDC047187]|uniref:hypothetical protein n=1 Tax=Micromonospora sp. NPDC047187 TaxID=3155262 RepID=UPI0033E06CFF